MGRRALIALGLPVAAMSVAIIGAVAGAGAQACTSSQNEPVGGMPAQLVPIFQGAAARYNLGSEGAAILAAINYEESDFGQSTLRGVHSGANSAGAAGPMQIGIGGTAGDTWDQIKVNAPGDPPGQPPNVYAEADALYSAANYLHSNGLTANPSSWQNAIWAYNHADWYVAAVIARAHTYYTRGLRSAGPVPASLNWPSAQTCAVAPGSYVDPFARVPKGHLVPERIDMGVDYADNSPDPILAIGDAIVSYAGPDPGWENGSSVNYELTDGPYAGRYVYVAESITPMVRTGQRVTAGQQVAAFAEPNVHGIETGWAAGPGRPFTKAETLGQQATSGDPGNNRTWCGNNFSQLLAQLGAPPGLPEGRPVVGAGC
jgi:hypothetical protein